MLCDKVIIPVVNSSLSWIRITKCLKIFNNFKVLFFTPVIENHLNTAVNPTCLHTWSSGSIPAFGSGGQGSILSGGIRALHRSHLESNLGHQIQKRECYHLLKILRHLVILIQLRKLLVVFFISCAYSSLNLVIFQ